jgi:transposase-like protein
MAERRGRRFWERAVGEVERSGAPHREVAARHGVRVGTLRSWVYRLRREGHAAAAGPSEVRLLPVEVVPSAPASQPIEVRVLGGDVLAFEVGTNVAYVAALAAALRYRAC